MLFAQTGQGVDIFFSNRDFDYWDADPATVPKHVKEKIDI